MTRTKRHSKLFGADEEAFVQASIDYLNDLRRPMTILHAHEERYRAVAKAHEAVHEAIRVVTGMSLADREAERQRQAGIEQRFKGASKGS